MKVLAITLILVVVVVGVFLLWGHVNWKQYISEKIELVKISTLRNAEYVDLERETSGIPRIVKKYFYLVLKDGAPIIKNALITQSGGFRAKPEMKDWSKMEAEQIFSSNPKAFVWSAKISVIPAVSIDVCDSYINGNGGMKGKILSSITLINEGNRSELNEGALQRYLAESVWMPTALLPSQGVEWTEIDDYRARASITDSGISVSLEFEFNDNGEIISVYTPRRYREVAGQYKLTPWGGKLSKYMEVDGYMIPRGGEVSWYLEDQVYTYWKASMVKVVYK